MPPSPCDAERVSAGEVPAGTSGVTAVLPPRPVFEPPPLPPGGAATMGVDLVEAVSAMTTAEEVAAEPAGEEADTALVAVEAAAALAAAAFAAACV